MLEHFEDWSEVIAHVKRESTLYYVPTPAQGPRLVIARIRHTSSDGPVRVWLRCPNNIHPSMIADESFIDKLYHWVPNVGAT